MRFFSYLDSEDHSRLFYIEPEEFTKQTNKEILAYGLGATLYMPATKPNIYEDILSKKHLGLTSLVICLEDAIGDFEVDLAEKLLYQNLELLAIAINDRKIQLEELPLIFIRIRDEEQLSRLLKHLHPFLHVLTGFNIPKFSKRNKPILEMIKEVSTIQNPLYVMPIVETSQVMYKETRIQELCSIKALLDEFYELILNVRMGATDFSGLYGIRRNVETTVYDIAVLQDCIADILNVFTRKDQSYVVSGPVWEHFTGKSRILKPMLRQTPFKERYGSAGLKTRRKFIDKELDGLLRETMLDITNGITGKTIIHPSHILAVQALNVVSFEEYLDAKEILENADGTKGVFKSTFSNKMNEIKPHLYWAEKIMKKSKLYGVLLEHATHIDLLTCNHDYTYSK